MRVWDIAPDRLCRNHLLGEHREVHAIWSILTCGKKGYAYHPETLRWKGKLKALFLRHQQLARELAARGYRHQSDLPAKLAKGKKCQDRYVDPPRRQIQILKSKKCACRV